MTLPISRLLIISVKAIFVTFVMSFALEFALANRESRIFSSSRPVKVKKDSASERPSSNSSCLSVPSP